MEDRCQDWQSSVVHAFFLTMFRPLHPIFPVVSHSSQVRSVMPFLDDQSHVWQQSQLSSTLSPTSMPTHSNTLSPCPSLPTAPTPWVLQLWLLQPCLQAQCWRC